MKVAFQISPKKKLSWSEAKCWFQANPMIMQYTWCFTKCMIYFTCKATQVTECNATIMDSYPLKRYTV